MDIIASITLESTELKRIANCHAESIVKHLNSLDTRSDERHKQLNSSLKAIFEVRSMHTWPLLYNTLEIYNCICDSGDLLFAHFFWFYNNILRLLLGSIKPLFKEYMSDSVTYYTYIEDGKVSVSIKKIWNLKTILNVLFRISGFSGRSKRGLIICWVQQYKSQCQNVNHEWSRHCR